MNRRSFLITAAAGLAAPAICKAENLMRLARPLGWAERGGLLIPIGDVRHIRIPFLLDSKAQWLEPLLFPAFHSLDLTVHNSTTDDEIRALARKEIRRLHPGYWRPSLES